MRFKSGSKWSLKFVFFRLTSTEADERERQRKEKREEKKAEASVGVARPRRVIRREEKVHKKSLKSAKNDFYLVIYFACFRKQSTQQNHNHNLLHETN
jgi:hypothetical protein